MPTYWGTGSTEQATGENAVAPVSEGKTAGISLSLGTSVFASGSTNGVGEGLSTRQYVPVFKKSMLSTNV